MNKDIESITGVLLELRDACRAIQSDLSDVSLHVLSRKYDIMFLGGKFNVIYSDELFHSLKAHWGYDISLSVYNSVLPEVCASLGMPCKRLIALEDVKKDNPPTYAFSIRLIG